MNERKINTGRMIYYLPKESVEAYEAAIQESPSPYYPIAYKFHISLSRMPGNIQNAIEILDDHIRSSGLTIGYKAISPGAAEDSFLKTPLRQGVEITLYPTGKRTENTDIKEEAKKWLRFIMELSKKFSAHNIIAGDISYTDNKINKYVSYRLTPYGVAQKIKQGKTNNYDERKIPVLGFAGEKVTEEKYSYEDIRLKIDSGSLPGKKLYNPLGWPDIIPEILEEVGKEVETLSSLSSTQELTVPYNFDDTTVPNSPVSPAAAAAPPASNSSKRIKRSGSWTDQISEEEKQKQQQQQQQY